MQLQRDLLDNIQKAGPRYTSYPSSNHFNSDFGRINFLKALWSVAGSQQNLSLYVHVPFCYQLCYFCGCNKVVGHKVSKIDAYLKTLLEEIALVSHEAQGQDGNPTNPVKQIHFGGGTPNSFTPTQLETVLTALQKGFDVAPDAEISIEIDPRHLSFNDLMAYKKMGFNRLSIGVQDFDPRVQKAINREQPQIAIETLVDEAFKMGFAGVNVDLIYGLPHQSLNSFETTLNAVCKIKPSRIALYSYAHMPERFKAQRLIKRADLPDPEEKLTLLDLAIHKLRQYGYQYIGLDHFALPSDALALAQQDGSLQRNFQGYSTHQGCNILGFGVSAISSINGRYAQNSKTISDYVEHISQGQLATSVGYQLNREELVRRDLIMQLMCSRRLSIPQFEQQHHIHFDTHFAAELTRLQPFIERGLVEISANSIAVTELGRFVLRAIAMVFDQYLDPQTEILTSQHAEVV